MSMLVAAARPPAEMLLRGAHVIDPNLGLDGRHDVLVRDGEIAELGTPGSIEAPPGRRSSTRRASTCSRVSSTRTFTCARPARSTRRTSRRAPAPRPPAATALWWRCRTPRTGARPAGPAARLLLAAARDARIPVGFMAAISVGLPGEQLTEMDELRELGAIGFTDDGLPVANAGLLRHALRYQRLCGGVDRPARGGPGALRRRRDARGRGLRPSSGWPGSRRSRSRR